MICNIYNVTTHKVKQQQKVSKLETKSFTSMNDWIINSMNVYIN